MSSDDGLWAGQRLGPCRLLRQVGSGATARVFLATLAEPQPYGDVGMEVAVKVLNPQLVRDVPGLLERFRREVHLGRALDHPALVRTYDVGDGEVETPAAPPQRCHFMIQEFIEGRTLRELLRRLNPVPEALLRQVALQVAAGLEALHRAGAIHRDLKPGNVLITDDHQVKLLDLGLALLPRERITLEGGFVGTLSYASPEQIEGDEVGPETDLYSLGVVLYEAATGVNPFRGSNNRITIERQRHHLPPRAGFLNPQLTALLEEIIAGLLSKEPAERLSAAELREVLAAGESASWWQMRQQLLHQRDRRAEPWRIDVARQTRFIGRFSELESLDSRCRQARLGHGQVVLLEGEAGIGKTRLLEEFLRRLTDYSSEVEVLYGRELPGRPGGSSALLEAVLEFFGKADLESRLSRYLSSSRRLAPLVAAHLLGDPALPEPPAKAAVHAVLVDLARGLAAEVPLIWIVEDLHCAGAESLEQFRALASETPNLPLLLIGSYVPDRLPPAAQAQLPAAFQLRVGRLSQAQVMELLADLLGNDGTAQELGEPLARQTDGNPFFLTEIVRDLKERGILRSHNGDGHYALAAEMLTTLSMPASVRELLAARLSGLSAAERTLLSLAALQGFTFDPDLVAGMSGASRLQVLNELAEIERRCGVIRAAGAGFRFDQHQLPELLAGGLPAAERQRQHLRLAEVYAEREGLATRPAAQLPGPMAAFLSRHFLLGGDLERGARTLLRALDFLAHRYHGEALLELASVAIAALGEELPALRCDVLLRQAECCSLLGRREEQAAAVAAALVAADQTGDEERRGWAELAAGKEQMMREQYGPARQVLEVALERAIRLALPQLQSAVLGILGSVVGFQGDFERARTFFEQQLEVAQQSGDRKQEAFSRYTLGAALIGMGYYREAMQHFEAGMPIFEEIRFFEVEAKATAMLGMILRGLGDYERARDEALASLKVAREIGFRQGEVVALFVLAQLALDEGQLGEAEQHLRRGLERCRGLQARLLESYLLLGLGDLAFARGQVAPAEENYRQALSWQRELSAQHAVAETALALGRLLVKRGDRDGALPLLQEAARLAAEYRLDLPGSLPAAYLALLGEGDPWQVPVHERMPVILQAEAHLVLYQAGAGDAHRLAADALLQQVSAHLNRVATSVFRRHNRTAWELNELRKSQNNIS